MLQLAIRGEFLTQKYQAQSLQQNPVSLYFFFQPFHESLLPYLLHPQNLVLSFFTYSLILHSRFKKYCKSWWNSVRECRDGTRGVFLFEREYICIRYWEEILGHEADATQSSPGCPEKLSLPHLWKSPRPGGTGLGTIWISGRCPCLWQRVE